MLLLDLFSCESSDKDWSSVPDDLDDFSRWEFRNIDLHVSVSVVSGPSGQSSDGSNGVESCKVQHTSIVDGTESIQLSSSDFGLVFVMYSVLVEPVIEGRLEIDVITEVSRPGRCDKEVGFIGYRVESV